MKYILYAYITTQCTGHVPIFTRHVANHIVPTSRNCPEFNIMHYRPIFIISFNLIVF